jgi:hypothetical protein
VVFGEIFAPIYPSQVSPKLCLLCRGVVEEEAFTQRERERATSKNKNEENKEMDKEQRTWFEKKQ